MSRIRAKHTIPELTLRRLLHSAGIRYRLHDRRLPGVPDLVLRKDKVAVFVHGCFWHGHDCHLFKVPATRTAFWLSKISANVHRDQRVTKELLRKDWRVMVVWECSLRGRLKRDRHEVLRRMVSFAKGRRKSGCIGSKGSRVPTGILRMPIKVDTNVKQHCLA